MQEKEIIVRRNAGDPSREERMRRKRKRRLRRVALLVGLLVLLAALLVWGTVFLVRAVAGRVSQEPPPEFPAASYDVSDHVFDPSDPLLVLVNGNAPLAAEPAELADTAAEGVRLQPEAAAAFKAMAAAAAQDGVELILTAGYADASTRLALYNACRQGYLDQGLDETEAAARAASVAGTPEGSEHGTGLAVDLATPDHLRQDTGFADTLAFSWLQSYAADYGFILRYPVDSQAVTGMVYQPWHWRYVGVENARAIFQSGSALEEFLALRLLERGE